MMPSTSAPRVVHIADGNAVEFTFDFAIFQSGDLEVLLDASLQADGFTIQGSYPSEGGTVVFQQAPAAGTVVTLQRRLSIERATDFQPSGALIANTLNGEFDRLVAMLQQVDEDASRAVRAGPTEVDANLLLPTREARAGRILGFDAAGDVTMLAPSLPELPTLDAIPEGVNNKHFTYSEKAKLATVEPHSEANPPQVTAEEKADGSEVSLRSFAPRDVAEMARIHAPAGAVTSVFGRTAAVDAQTGDYTADQITDTANKVMMTAAERARLCGFVTVTEFGAVGDGVTDDTAAFVAAAAHAVQNKKALRVPAATYLLKQCISFANAPVALLGDGVGLSVLKWAADATGSGISATAKSSEHSHLVRDLSFLICKKGGTAVNLDYTGQVDNSSGKPTTMDRTSPRFLIENCFFAGAADPWNTGWDYGVVATAAVSGIIANSVFTGWLVGNSPPLVPGSPAGFFIRGTNTDLDNGHPVQFLVLGCSAYYTQNAVALNGIEGDSYKAATL